MPHAERRLEEDEQRRARKAAAHAGVGAPSSVTLASGRLGGSRIFPGIDVSLHLPKDKW